MTAVCDVHLHRRDVNEPWGFSMVGGREQYKPLTVTKVRRNSPSEGQLEEGEEILMIDDTKAVNIFHHHAVGLIKNTGVYLKLTVSRSAMTAGAPSAVWRHVAATVEDARKPTPYMAPAPIYNPEKANLPKPYRSPPDRKNIPVNVPQIQTISHLKPEEPKPVEQLQRAKSPINEFPPIPAESQLSATLPPPRAKSPNPYSANPPRPYSPNPQTSTPPSGGNSRVTSRPSGTSMGQNLPLTVFYSTPDVAFVGHPSASTKTVDVNLPVGLGHTIVGVRSVFPQRAPPRIGRKKEGGASIMMRV